MPLNIIPAHTKNTQLIKKEENNFLEIAELFADTIQGEGISIGHPATFLRLKGCVLNCVWCDTTAVWKDGDKYTFEQIFILLEKHNVIQKLKQHQRLIITGGSPLKQQKKIIAFIIHFKKKYGFKPYIEIENEVVLPIQKDLIPLIDQWNHSPKLSHSKMKKSHRYFSEIIQQAASLKNAWFKFVVASQADWEEIEADFLMPKLLHANQIILMPMADNRKQLDALRERIVDVAIQKRVRFCDRLHITLYDKKTGV